MFDSTYFDNSNKRPFVQQPSELGMDNSDYVRLIVEHNIGKRSELRKSQRRKPKRTPKTP